MSQDYFGRGPAWNFHHGGHDSWSSWKETDFLCRVQPSGRYLIALFLSLLLPLSLSFSLPFFKICFNAFQKQFSPLVFFERIWLCVSEGESAFLDVHDCGVQQQAPVPGNIRRYYMMVDEYLWDYAPTGMDMYSGTPLISEDRWDISARWPFCLCYWSCSQSYLINKIPCLVGRFKVWRELQLKNCFNRKRPRFMIKIYSNYM